MSLSPSPKELTVFEFCVETISQLSEQPCQSHVSEKDVLQIFRGCGSVLVEHIQC